MNPFARHTDPITSERVQMSIRARFNPIPSLTPSLLSAYLESFRLGFFRNIALTWDAMERRDYTLQSVAAKRKKSVARRGWEILTTENSPAARAQKAALEYFYNHLTATNALEENETGGFSLLVRQMMDAVGKRYAVHEIIWQPRPQLMVDRGEVDGKGNNGVGVDGAEGQGATGSGKPQLTATFRFCPLWWFEGTRGRLRFLPSEFGIYGVDMEPGSWLVTAGDGLMEACSVAYMYKHMPLRDWLSCSEKFGMPAIVGRTDATLDSEEWNEFAAAIQKFSQDWSAVFNRSNSIELIEPKNPADQLFAALVDKMDRAMTALWRGGDLSTMSVRNAAGASLQQNEADILEIDDAQLIGETLTTQVSRYVLQYHFGNAPQLAYIKIRGSDKRDTELDLKVDQFLVQSGAPLAVKDALARYDRPAPAAGEALLTPPAKPEPIKPETGILASLDNESDALERSENGDPQAAAPQKNELSVE